MPKHGWLLYRREDAERNQPFINMFIEEARKQDIHLHVYYRESIHIGIQQNKLIFLLDGEQISLPEFAIVRTIDSLLTEQLEQLGVVCFNSSFVARICNDKTKTHQLLVNKGIPMVDTLFVKRSELSNLPFSFPLIVKGVHGRGGREVFWIEQESDYQTLPFQFNQELIVQKPAPYVGKDLRVFIVGNTIVGAILRESTKDFKANYTLGGSASLYTLSPREIELVYQIIEPFEFGMVGIDFLFDESHQLLFNEIEDVVGSRTLYNESSVNILNHYLSYIKQKINRLA